MWIALFTTFCTAGNEGVRRLVARRLTVVARLNGYVSDTERRRPFDDTTVRPASTALGRGEVDSVRRPVRVTGGFGENHSAIVSSSDDTLAHERLKGPRPVYYIGPTPRHMISVLLSLAVKAPTLTSARDTRRSGRNLVGRDGIARGGDVEQPASAMTAKIRAPRAAHRASLLRVDRTARGWLVRDYNQEFTSPSIAHYERPVPPTPCVAVCDLGRAW